MAKAQYEKEGKGEKLIDSNTIESNTGLDYGHSLRGIRAILGNFIIKEKYMNKNAFSMNMKELTEAKENLFALGKQMDKLEKQLLKDGIKWQLSNERRMLKKNV